MLELLENLLSPYPYIPHGHCYLCQTPLVGLHLVSDALIAIAYFSIPAMLIYFFDKGSNLPFSKVFVLFGALMIMCGSGHILDIWTLWHSDDLLSGIERALTALVSCYTALQLVKFLPKFLALPTPEQLEAANREERKRAEEEKCCAEEELEFRVEERTAKLVAANAANQTEIQERIAVETAMRLMAKREKAIARVMVRMRQSLNLESIFHATTAELRQAISCDRVLIYRFNPDWSGALVSQSVADGWDVLLPKRANDPELTKVAVDQPDCVTTRLDSSDGLIRDTYLQENEGGIYRQKTSYCCVPDIYKAYIKSEEKKLRQVLINLLGNAIKFTEKGSEP